MMLSGPFKSSLKLRGMNGKIMQGDSTLEYYSRIYREYIVEYLGGFSRETEPIGNCEIYYNELAYTVMEAGKSQISRADVIV